MTRWFLTNLVGLILVCAAWPSSGQVMTSECTAYKYELAQLASNVTLCLVKFSQPLRICEYCRESWILLKEKYEQIVNNSDYKESYCKTQLLYSDIISVVSDLYLVIEMQWSTMNCDDCYKDQKGSRNPNFAEFLQLEDEVLTCLSNYTDADLDYRNVYFEADWKDKKFNETACDRCQGFYKTINNFYNHVESKMKKEETTKFWNGICGDMGEMMNMTRLLWSKKFNCNLVTIEWYWAIGPICTVTAMILLFYCMVSTYFHDKIDMTMYKQRRLRPLLEQMDSTLLETIQ